MLVSYTVGDATSCSGVVLGTPAVSGVDAAVSVPCEVSVYCGWTSVSVRGMVLTLQYLSRVKSQCTARRLPLYAVWC